MKQVWIDMPKEEHHKNNLILALLAIGYTVRITDLWIVFTTVDNNVKDAV
jgi:hypothetical protein